MCAKEISSKIKYLTLTLTGAGILALSDCKLRMFGSKSQKIVSLLLCLCQVTAIPHYSISAIKPIQEPYINSRTSSPFNTSASVVLMINCLKQDWEKSQLVRKHHWKTVYHAWSQSWVWGNEWVNHNKIADVRLSHHVIESINVLLMMKTTIRYTIGEV